MPETGARTVLLVEDEDDYRHALAHMLARAGHRVLEAADSMQALNVLDTPQHLDLMVVDVLMPEGRPHGLALARMASLRRPGLKVVYITAYYDQLPAGVVARNAPIIRKTSRIEDVVRAIEDALP